MNSVTASAQTFVVKNNLLYDATLTPNLGFEGAVAPRWTIGLNGGFNPWKHPYSDKEKQLRHVFISPEARVKYQKYASLANATETDKRTLDMQREKFAKASAREQRQMRETMVRLEYQIAEDHDRMQKLAKEIRYVENRVRQ
jgi:hypothetical protein